MNKEATYMKVNPETILKFKKIIEKPSVDLERLKKDKAIKRLVESDGNSSASESSDE